MMSLTFRRNAVAFMFAMLATVFCALAAPAHAASATPIDNIDLSPYLAVPSGASDYVNIGGTTYFVAYSGVHGRELFKTNGTPGSTVMIKDITPGSGSSVISYLAVMGSNVYFFLESGATQQLWKTDGTPAGTVMVKDLQTAVAPRDLTCCGGKLYFMGYDSVHGKELWVSDGTAGGTFMVRDINTGSGMAADSLPCRFAEMNGKAIFTAVDGVHGDEPWVTDGTAGGTYLLKDIMPGSYGSHPRDYITYNGAVYFSATAKVWKTQGTEATTSYFSGFFPDNDWDPLVFNGKLYFSGCVTGLSYWQEELLVCDGTSISSVKLLESGNQMKEVGKVIVGSYFYFVTSNIITNEVKLWKSDGTAGGTTLLKQLAAPSSPTYYSLFTTAEVGGRLVFIMDDQGLSAQLWTSDGTANGTIKLKDFNLDEEYDDENGVFIPHVSAKSVNGLLYFTEYINLEDSPLWATDGTQAGTRIVKENASSLNRLKMDVNSCRGLMFFIYNDAAHGEELWRSDGTEAGTFMVKDINPGATGSSPHAFAAYMNKLYFVADDGTHGAELWRSDGTANGTAMVTDLRSGSASSFHDSKYDWCFGTGSKLFFEAADNAHGTGLWVLDSPTGTPAFVAGLQAYLPPAWDPVIRTRCDWNGRLVLCANDGSSGNELWISDGTSPGTRMIKDLSTGSAGSDITMPTPVGNYLYFNAGFLKMRLYRTDGTEAGTSLIASNDTNQPVEYLYELGGVAVVGFRHYLYNYGSDQDGWCGYGYNVSAPFIGSVYCTSEGDHEFYKKSGSGSPVLLKDINPSGASTPDHYAIMNGRLYFAATDAAHGREIWSTDGTADGTVLTADVIAGAGSSDPSDLIEVGGKLFFVANADRLMILGGRAETFAIAAGDTAPVSSSTAGIAVDFSANSAPGQLGLMKIDGAAPGRSGDPAGYWQLSGMQNSMFSVTLTFSYDPAALSSAGISPANLCLINSVDGGRTWREVASVVHSSSNTISTLSPQSSLGWWALCSVDRSPSREMWVNFYWSYFETGTAEEPFNTLAEAAGAVLSGGRVRINAGTTAERPRITKPMRIESVGGTVRIGN